MKISILGNSVALRIRPPRANESEKTYAEHLARQGHEVRNIARAGTLLPEAFATLEDDVIAAFPDVVIIHYGVVEVCYRQTARWINNRTIQNYYLNRWFARPYVFASLPQRLRLLSWRMLNGLIRRAAAWCGLRWQWLPPDRFMEVMNATVRVILKDTSAHVFVIGLNPPSERVDRILHGSAEAITRTNRLLAEWCLGQGTRVTYLDPGLFIPDQSSDTHVPDGIHFAAEGHRLLAEAISIRLPRFS